MASKKYHTQHLIDMGYYQLQIQHQDEQEKDNDGENELPAQNQA